MDKNTVTNNGVETADGWPRRIEEAQRQTTYLIGGHQYGRIRFGDERDDWARTGSPVTTAR